MNFNNILNAIAEQDPEVFEKVSERRDVIKNFTRKVSLVALPFAVGSLFNKAYGKSTDIIIDTLNFALTLEILEAAFYNQGLASSSLAIPASDRPAFVTISTHENAHVAFLTNTINSLSGTPVSLASFTIDLTAGGAFADVLSNYSTFLAVSQTFEDTGVRAYKGQAANLMGNSAILGAALQIHSVEARHAAHIREIRALAGASVSPWITGNQSGITGAAGTAVQPSYNGEDNTTQAGVNIATIKSGAVALNANSASEAFDEPLDKAAVVAIVTPFIH
ncbi:MAG: ferritin-like domain-containing protein [Taibaiella sp.]|nr:ferritin-like domain-containing protein [Taibaiella sp.]